MGKGQYKYLCISVLKDEDGKTQTLEDIHSVIRMFGDLTLQHIVLVVVNSKILGELLRVQEW